MTPRVVLIGPMGAGKSTVAALLAARLGLRTRDTDRDVESLAGKSVRDIFVDDGEAAFRALEREAVAAAMAEHSGVLSLGGGAVLDPRTRDLLQGHVVVLLDVDVHHAAQRIGLNRGRPLLVGNPRARWSALMAERRPVYEKVASVIIDSSGRTPDEVTDQVQAALERLP